MSVKPDPFQSIRTLGIMRDHLLDGPVVDWTPDGKVVSERWMRDAQLDGPSRWFYESGALSRQVEFRNGMRHGCDGVYAESGEMVYAQWFNHGVASGRLVKWHGLGAIAETSTYVVGLRHGISQNFDPDGSLIDQFKWSYGRLVSGSHDDFADPGLGRWVHYGFLSVKQEIERDDPSKTRLTAYFNDDRVWECGVDEGRLDGELVQWNEDGEEVNRSRWDMGVRA